VDGATISWERGPLDRLTPSGRRGGSTTVSVKGKKVVDLPTRLAGNCRPSGHWDRSFPDGSTTVYG